MGQRVLLIFFQKAVPSSGFHLSRWKQQTPLDSSHFLLLHIQSTCQVLLSLPLKQILNLFPSISTITTLSKPGVISYLDC